MQRNNSKRTFTFFILTIGVVGLLAACANMMNIRSFSTSLATLTSDTTNIINADASACDEIAALDAEFAKITALAVTHPDCKSLDTTTNKIVVENKAIQAYGAAIGNLAQDQYVNSASDAGTVDSILKATGLTTDPIAAAVKDVFAIVEKAFLEGYRRDRLEDAMTGPSGDAFKKIMADYMALANQYAIELKAESGDIQAVINLFTSDYRRAEPVASAELVSRLMALKASVDNRAGSIKSFADAVAKADKAFDAAVQDIEHPTPKDLYSEVSSFASMIKTADADIKKAFGK